MNIQEDIIRILKEYRDVVCDGNSSRAALSLNATAPTFWRWMQGKSIPKVETLIPVFSALNARITLPTDKEAPVDALELATLKKENSELKKENIRLQAQVDILKEVVQPHTATPSEPEASLRKLAG